MIFLGGNSKIMGNGGKMEVAAEAAAAAAAAAAVALA